MGGLRAGYDYEAGNVLFGAMADYAFTNIGTEASATIPGLGSAEIGSNLTSLATLRARAGTTYKNMLYYVHGGAAMGTVEMTANGDDIPGTIDNPRFGYTLGAGIEYAIGENATFQTEYSFLDLGEQDIYSSGGYTLADDFSVHMISSGITLRF